MTNSGLRKLRVAFKFGLLVSLPVAGYLWAQTGPSMVSIIVSAVCVVLALGAESLASMAENRLAHLRAADEEEERIYQNAVATRAEKIRQMDRIVETLSNQNHDLRGKLISLHGEVHRTQTELGELDQPAQGEPDAAGTAEGGDVTDISSLRNRR